MAAAEPTQVQEERVALFISHAGPEGNPFTIWLGAKLSALGYEVWADVLRLRGGDDWERKLECALRERAREPSTSRAFSWTSPRSERWVRNWTPMSQKLCAD
jgi:TIR domain-containing protein